MNHQEQLTAAAGTDQLQERVRELLEINEEHRKLNGLLREEVDKLKRMIMLSVKVLLREE